jgi:hypothetical protein
MTHSKEDPKTLVQQAEDLGYAAFGPVLMRFSAWLASEASSLRLKRLYFLSREGYFLLRLFNKYVALGLSPNPNIETKYLSISRRAAYGAAEKTRESLKAMLMAGPFEGDLYKLLEGRMGLDKAFCEKVRLPNSPIALPVDVEKILDILTSALPALNDHAKTEREPLNGYLKQEGIYEHETAALVDLGYSASIQRWLHRITSQKMVGFYFATTKVVNDFEAEDNRVLACFATDCGAFRSPPVYRYALTLESWLTAPTGQVLRFNRSGDTYGPEHAPTGKMQDLFRVATGVANGVERYFDDIAFLARYEPEWEKNLQASSQDVLAATLESQAFTSVLDFLSVEDAFCGHGEISLTERLSDLMSDMRLSEMIVDGEKRSG